VTAERVAAFAAATGTPYDEGDPAPATFPIVVAFAAMQALMEDPDVGIELSNVIHGEQRFGYQRQVVVGDRLSAALTVDTLRQIGGADIIGTTSAITDADGALVCTATNPACETCPIHGRCEWLRRGRPPYDGPPRRGQAWAGTDRQVRGRLMAVLRESVGSVARSRLDSVWSDATQRERALQSLLADGLVVEAEGRYALPT